ncbi:transposable element Tcb2 transposase [Trichonephila clavipes]|nr:transposable element Tcb2 transposase [Trichonephila clavipes]
MQSATVHYLWRRWFAHGNVERSRGPAAARVMSAREDRRIHRQAVEAPQTTSTSILQHVQYNLDVPISTRTMSRLFFESGLHSRRPHRTLALIPQRRRARLKWCRARAIWMTECRNVVFLDKSLFCFFNDSQRIRVWRRRGKRSNPAVTVERPTARQRGIMVWGAIAYNSTSPLVRIQGTLNAQRYVQNVLRPVAIPYLQGMPNAIFQQDNSRLHTARISQHALRGVQMLPWQRTLLISHQSNTCGMSLDAVCKLFPCLVRTTNFGEWLKGNGEPSLRTPSALLLTRYLDVFLRASPLAVALHPTELMPCALCYQNIGSK